MTRDVNRPQRITEMCNEVTGTRTMKSEVMKINSKKKRARFVSLAELSITFSVI